MTAVTPKQAIERAAHQSRTGPRFAVGMCKRETRKLYSVPSDGSDSAAEAWRRTKHRLDVDPADAPGGSLLWWTGGHDGNGHVAIKAFAPGWCWSVDFRRPGYWDRVLIADIGRKWSALRFAGVSLDIDGVQVVHRQHPTPNLDAALKGLRHARDARKPGRMRTRIGQAILDVLGIRKDVRR